MKKLIFVLCTLLSMNVFAGTFTRDLALKKGEVICSDVKQKCPKGELSRLAIAEFSNLVMSVDSLCHRTISDLVYATGDRKGEKETIGKMCSTKFKVTNPDDVAGVKDLLDELEDFVNAQTKFKISFLEMSSSPRAPADRELLIKNREAVLPLLQKAEASFDKYVMIVTSLRSSR